ncbi:MAG: hypothetical protein Ct9H90mP23_2720 [Methanobacteriota archaeon]|nr:MAG: hypothetical protein Ct9H90mP23_2720 [Euryarchaeota archaeon]
MDSRRPWSASFVHYRDDDFDNPAHPVSGIVVQAPITDEGSDGDTWYTLSWEGYSLSQLQW